MQPTAQTLELARRLKLAAQSPTQMAASSEAPLLFVGTEADRDYLAKLKELTGSRAVKLLLRPVSTVAEVEIVAKQNGIKGVIFTSIVLLERLSQDPKAKLDDYAGSLFTRSGIEYLCVFPLERMVQQNYIPHLQRRFISKLTTPDAWISFPPFRYTLLTEENIEEAYTRISQALLVGVDIETLKEPLAIRCIGYTAVCRNLDGTVALYSYTLPLDSLWALAWMRRINALPVPKTLQNGKYDCAYLFRYNAPLTNWLFDTATGFHSWYCELPKDLGALAAYASRAIIYWKNKGTSGDLSELYEYCALDTYHTVCVTLWWMKEAPEWAKQNFLQEFPLLFPCHVCEMTGIKRDMVQLKVENERANRAIESKYASLRSMLGEPHFNTNSHVQVKNLLRVLGIKDPDSSDEKSLLAAAYLHPLNNRILQLIIDIRGARKLISTYLGVGQNDKGKSLAKEFGPPGRERILSAFNPHGTDSGRLASREHHFWIGLQLQNIPVEEPGAPSVKSTLVPDPGFALAECDLKQAESRDTGYIVGSEAIIAAVTGTRDFHSVNAAAFFGKPYESIFDDATGKTKDKPLRNLSKRVNHGANYNMGPGVLVDTMGLKAIYEAKKLLDLRGWLTPKQIAEELLKRFHTTYPELHKLYHPAVINEIRTTSMLVGATGWTRYCFGTPWNSKQDLNAYVAHCPQSLNAMKLNKAFMRVFYELWMPHHQDFKLIAQIHDSIFFQYRIGMDWIPQRVSELMQVPCTVRGCDGKTRTYTVPADVKAGKDGTGAARWSLTE